MSIKQGRQARLADVTKAIEDHRPFSADPDLQLGFVLPTAKPQHSAYLGRKDRAYIYNLANGKILLTAPSAYALVEKIRSGWKYEPNKKEGLWV